MQDYAVVEKWNPISSAEMAVGVKGALYRALNGKPRPFDFVESLEKGIDFLAEASDGGAIICGETPKRGFTGTLSPFTLTMRFVPGDRQEFDETDYYRQVVRTLRSYQSVLDDLRNDKEVKPDVLENAHKFFDDIAVIMMREADPITKNVSRVRL